MRYAASASSSRPCSRAGRRDGRRHHHHPGRFWRGRPPQLRRTGPAPGAGPENEGRPTVALVDPGAIRRLGFVEPALLLEQVSEKAGARHCTPRSIPVRYTASASSSRPCSSSRIPRSDGGIVVAQVDPAPIRRLGLREPALLREQDSEMMAALSYAQLDPAPIRRLGFLEAGPAPRAGLRDRRRRHCRPGRSRCERPPQPRRAGPAP